MAGNPKPKGKKSAWLKPGMLTLAAVFLWSAGHEPAVFNAASLSLWLLGALTAGLLVQAALTLAAPLLGIFAAVLSQATRILQRGPEA